MAPIDVLLAIVLVLVTLTLAFGVFQLTRSGREARTTSNKLMRMRVALQFIAVIILVIAFAVKRGGLGG